MIVTAQHHVFLQSPYFIPDASIAEALKSAALAGVDVKVMLSARPSGNPIPAWAGNTFMLEAVEAGVRVFLYQKGYLHAKTISIDSEICSIGSANLDIRSFSINYEINAVLYSDPLALELEADFARDLSTAPSSTPPPTAPGTPPPGSATRSRDCPRPCCENLCRGRLRRSHATSRTRGHGRALWLKHDQAQRWCGGLDPRPH